MFPIKLTLTVSTVDQLNRLTALVSDGYAAAVADAPKLPAEEVAAPSQPTAEVVADAAPVKTAAAPASSSAASAEAQPPASTAATEPFPYAKLQALVFKHLPAHGAALLEVSKKHGAAKFKELPADKWQAAYDNLVAAYGE